MKRIFLVPVLSVFALGACDISTPSQVNLRQIQLREGMKTETLDARRVDASQAEVIGARYRQSGKGPATLTVSYPAHMAGARMAAERQAVAWRTALQAQGMTVSAPEFVEVDDSSRAGVAVLSWRALLAEPPKDCGRIPGYQGSGTMTDIEGYSIGCETQSAISRMVANPADLLGRAGTPASDAKREGSIVEKNRAGTPNGKLNGLSASTVGAGGG